MEYTIIVVGEPTKGTMASVASNLKILRFEDVEREGTKREKVLSPIPSEFVMFAADEMNAERQNLA
jgi:long-chain acyl-CoA synthetase